MTKRTLAWWAALVVVGSGFHMVEHIVQAVQKYGMEHQHAHGLLGAFFDNDPAHFVYNWAFFFALVPILRAGSAVGSTGTWLAFTTGFAVQSYHVVEHTVKTAQWAAGADPALGILGNWFSLVPLHLMLNGVVYLLVAPQLLAWAWQAFHAPATPGVALRAS
jgi:hypothetical protein